MRRADALAAGVVQEALSAGLNHVSIHT